MHRFLLVLPVFALSACMGPAPQSSDLATPAAPFAMPMDPGQIRCSDLSNPSALAAATEWTMGRVRAAVLAGRVASVPDAPTLSDALSAFCTANRSGTVRAASAQLGY